MHSCMCWKLDDVDHWDHGQALALLAFALGQALAFGDEVRPPVVFSENARGLTPMPVCYDPGRMIWRSKRNDGAGCTLAAAVQ